MRLVNIIISCRRWSGAKSPIDGNTICSPCWSTD